MPATPVTVKSFGFKQGLRQPSIELVLRFLVIPEPDFQKLDQFLVEWLKLNKGSLSLPCPGLVGTTEGLIRRCHALALHLCQQSYLPVFDDFRVLTCSTHNTASPRNEVRLLIPVIESISIAIFETIWSFALHVCCRFLESKAPIERYGPDFDQAFARQIKPLQTRIPGGKSTVPILMASFGENIPFSHLGSGAYRLGQGSRSQLFDRSSIGTDSAIGSRISHDKQLTKNLLSLLGLPTPKSFVIQTQEQALVAAESLGFPLVAKPSDRDRGEGVSIGIRDTRVLTEAFEKAKRYSDNVMIEEEIPGTCHRLLIVNGQFVSAVKRHPRRLLGDGIHTVEELFRTEEKTSQNQALHLRQPTLALDATTLESIRASGFAVAQIPQKEGFVPLRPIETAEWGGSPENVTELVHPDNVRVAIDAARALGLTIAGVDLVSEDIGRPWHENGAAINEVNYAPMVLGLTRTSQGPIENWLVDLFPNQGRIPIEVFLGDQRAFDRARKKQQLHTKKGLACFLAGHDITLDPLGKVLPLKEMAEGLFFRCQSLLANPRVEALVVWVQTDEFALRGLPMDQIDDLVIVNQGLISFEDPGRLASDDQVQATLASLRHYLLRPNGASGRN